MEDREPLGRTLAPEEIERMRLVLLAAISRTCPPWLASQKEDLLQAAFLRLFKIWKTSEESAPPSTSYVWKAAYAVIMDEIRRARVRRERPMDPGGMTVENGHPRARPERQRHAAELRAAIVEGLQTLEPGRRRVVQLYLSGFTLKQSAVVLGWSSKRVDNERYRGLAALRGFLTDKGFSP